MQSKVYELLHEWGIKKKVFTITLNDKRCGDEMPDLLRERLNKLSGALPCLGDLFEIPCNAHIMDFMAEECFKAIYKAICKIREGVQYVVGHEQRRLKFEDAAKFCCGGSLEPLWLDCSTRWNSTYLMLERAVKYREAFAYVMVGDGHTDWHLTGEEWSRVEKVCKLLKPLSDFASLFVGTEFPTSNLYFTPVWKTCTLLAEEMGGEDLVIRDMIRNFKPEFDEFWDCWNEVLVLPMVFDPRYKLRSLEFCYHKLGSTSAEERLSYVRKLLHKLFKLYLDISPTDHLDIDSKNNAGEKGFEEDRSQLDQYLNVPKLECLDKLDVLSWWEENEGRFPELALMARDVLSIPITGFSQDSIFGMGYRVQVRWSGSSQPKCTEALVATRNWVYGYQVDEDYPGGLMGIEQRFWTVKNEQDDSDDEQAPKY